MTRFDEGHIRKSTFTQVRDAEHGGHPQLKSPYVWKSLTGQVSKKNSFPFSFVSIKKESACRSHSSSCSEARCSSVATLSGLLYKSMYFFIASISEKRTLNSDYKLSILEAKDKNSEPPKSHSSSADLCMMGSGINHFLQTCLKKAVCCEIHSHSQTDLVQFDPYLEGLF